MFKKISLLIVLILIIGCDGNNKRESSVEQENTFLKNDKVYLENEARKLINKKYSKKYTSLKSINIKNKAFSIKDLNEDGLLDVFVFLCFFDEDDNSFKETEVLYYKNDGKSLILNDYRAFKEYLYPDNNRNVSENSLPTKEVNPDNSKNIEGHSIRSKEGYIYLFEDGLYYTIVESSQGYGDIDNYGISEEDYYKYVIAENGLIYRDEPDGEAIGKFSYGKQVHIVGETNLSKIIHDDYDKVSGKWVVVELDGGVNETAFVFDGYLGEEYDLE